LWFERFSFDLRDGNTAPSSGLGVEPIVKGCGWGSTPVPADRFNHTSLGVPVRRHRTSPLNPRQGRPDKSSSTVFLPQSLAITGTSPPASTPSVPPRAELLYVLLLPDYDRAGRIGEYYGNPLTRSFAELTSCA
jgi:hypothetical protein